MANQLANQQTINLAGELSTNLNKNKIAPFTGFNNRHNPYLNGSLKAFSKTEVTDTDIIDKYGNLYKWAENGKVFKNGEELFHVNRSFVKKTVLSIPSDIEYIDIRPLSGTQFVYVTSERKVYYYNGSESVLIYTGDTEHIATFQLYIKSYRGDTNVKYVSVIDAIYGDASTISSIHLSVFSFSGNSLTEILSREYFFSTALKYFQVGISSFYLEGAHHRYIAIRPVSLLNKTFDAPANDSTSTVPLIIACLDNSGYEANTTLPEKFYFNFENNNNYLFNTNYNYYQESAGTYAYAVYYEEYFNGVLSFSLSGTQLQVEINSLSSNPIDKIEFVQRPTITPNFNFYSRKNLVNDYVVSSNLCVGLESSVSNTKTATFKSTDLGMIVYGGGCTISEDTSADFSRNYSVQLGNFSVVFDSNTVAAISLTTENRDNTLITPWLSVKTDFFMPYLIGGKLFFQDEEGFKMLETSSSSTYKLLFNRYILFYTNQYFNIYDIETNKWSHFASDWNNRILIGESIQLSSPEKSRVFKGSHSVEIASGLNVNYNISKEKNTTAMMQPKLYHNCVNFDEIKQLYIESTAEFDFYISKSTDAEAVTVPKYSKTLSKLSSNLNKFRIKPELNDVNYPVATDGNILLNPSVFFELYETQFQTDYIKEGINYYTLMYDNGLPYFIYAYGSQLNNINNLFILQGQPYILRNNIICVATISNNIVTNISSVINCSNMQYLGATISSAYFYSPDDKYIYVFNGDRRLEKTWEISEINTLYAACYSVDTSTFYLLTDNGCYAVVNDEYIYNIKGDYNHIQFLIGGIALQNTTEPKNWSLYYYYGEGDKEPIELETAFYGVGSNKLSVIDCWYLRLYSETPIEGNVSCSITTLTNKGEVTDSQMFHITSNMWDKITNTYYLRYQPKNQRSIGTSLKVKSDFDIIDLQCSVTPDIPVQISSPAIKTITTGAKI